MATAFHPTPRTTAAGATALCWGRIVAITATLVFDAALVWGVAQLVA